MYAERAAFLDSLPRKFPNNGIYTVMGDFNIPIDPRRDAAQLHHRHDNGRAELLSMAGGNVSRRRMALAQRRVE